MKPSFHAVRSPVRRPGADAYLLITLLSFALSVTLTRLFLYLTGYPQIGGGTLHIAHVLWGGLLLFVAALLPLIFANRWVYQMVAVMAGVGAGLFIDEVGKFITQNNDYFYQPAAPIIYAFFLVGVLVYLRVSQQPPRRSRHEFYSALEAIEELVDQDLDPGERAALEVRLSFVAGQEDDPQLARLAGEMLRFLTSEGISLAPAHPAWWKAMQERYLGMEAGLLNRGRFRALLVAGLGLLGLASLLNYFRLMLPGLTPRLFGPPSSPLVQAGLAPAASYSYWYSMLGVFHGLTGLLLVASLVMLLAKRESLALSLSAYLLLIHLTILDLLMFYYFQFDTILFAILQFVLLLAVSVYRRRYIENASIN